MARSLMNPLLLLGALSTTVNAYWLMGIGQSIADDDGMANADFCSENIITTQRIDPVVNPGKVSGHAHSGRTSLN